MARGPRWEAAGGVLGKRQGRELARQRHVARIRVNGTIDRQAIEQVAPGRPLEMKPSSWCRLNPQVDIAQNGPAAVGR